MYLEQPYPKVVFTTLHTLAKETDAPLFEGRTTRGEWCPDLYAELAFFTFTKNKKVYCQKHGYPLLLKTDGWQDDIPIGYEKVFIIEDAFRSFPECEWVFFSECDTMITNMNIRLEDIVEYEDNHVVLGTDMNGINAGSFFIRNTPEGRGYIQAMKESIGSFEHEQAFMNETYFVTGKFKDRVSLYPQRMFNSYDFSVTDGGTKSEEDNYDILGNNGGWRLGDFIVHWAGTAMPLRVQAALKYVHRVINGDEPVTIDLLYSAKNTIIPMKTSRMETIRHFSDVRNCTREIIDQINNIKIYDGFFNDALDWTILDIGANIGLFALYIHECAKVLYAFEPTPVHYNILTEMTRSYSNIVPVNMAVHSSTQPISFYLSDENTTMNSTVNNYNTKITVDATTIEDFIKQNQIDKVDFIKCDIEGSEMETLTYDTVKPLYDYVDRWFIEAHGTESGTIHENRNIMRQLFEDVGYKVEDRLDDGLWITK
jgi:FkbM family methyltransferase